jgi:hypothetical protein
LPASASVQFAVDMKFEFTKHASDQMLNRSITVQQVLDVLENPQQVVEQSDYTVYQSIIKFGNKDYLVRVFLNVIVSPFRVITVYKTSKIDKYNEGEI